MEPSKANTVGIVKNFLPAHIQLVRPYNSSERVQDYFFFHKMERME